MDGYRGAALVYGLICAVSGYSVAADAIVSPTQGLFTTEEGHQTGFSIRLSSQPSGSVTIGISSSDPTEATVSPDSLTLTPDDWDQPQSVTVTGVDDAVEDGDVGFTIVTAAAVSADPAYDGLDPADVSAVNRDNETLVTGRIEGYWRFEEGAGSSASDSSGTNNGTLVGTPQWSTATPASLGARSAHSLLLDGDDYVTAPDSQTLDLGTSPHTVTAWVRLTSTSGIIPVVCKSAGGSVDYCYRIGVTAGDARIASYNGTTAVGGSMAVSAGEWHFLAWVYYNDAVYFAVDGQPDPSARVAQTGGGANDGPMLIGGDEDGNRLTGNIDNVRIYRRPLMLKEVQVLAGMDVHAPEVAQIASSVGNDSDGVYAVDSAVVLAATEFAGEAGLTATLTIASISAGFSLDPVPMADGGDGTYSYSWDTTGRSVADDYEVEVKLTDAAGNESGGASITLSLATDSTSPTVMATSPADGEPATQRRMNLVVVFSEPMDSSVDPATVAQLTGGAATGTWRWSSRDRALVFECAQDLEAGTTYSLEIDATKARDQAGNQLAGTNVFSFTTH